MSKRVSRIIGLVLAFAMMFSVGIKMLPNLIITKEERVLRDFMGEYTYYDYAFAIEYSLMSSGTPSKDEVPPTKLIVSENSLQKKHFNDSSHIYDPAIQNDVKYLCKKVDDDLLENGLSFQGRALRRFFPTNADFHETSMESYVIFTDSPATVDVPATAHDKDVFYYIDGTYYYAESLLAVYELRRSSK